MGKRKVNTWAYVLIAAILLGGFLFALRDQILPPANMSGSRLIVTYSDGSQRTFDSNSNSRGLTLTDSTTGRTVTSIRSEIYVTASWTAYSPLSYYSLTGGSMEVRLWRLNVNPPLQVYQSGTVPLSPFNPLPTMYMSQPLVISSSTLTSAQIQALYNGWQNGQSYRLTFAMGEPVIVTLHFQDGSTASKSAIAPTATWNFRYTNGLSMVSLSTSFGGS